MRRIKISLGIVGWLFVVNLSGFAQAETNEADSVILGQLDNLMNSWYAKKAEYYNNSQSPFEDGGYESANEDSVRMHRLELIANQTLFPMVYNDEVSAYIRLYIRKAKQVSVMLGLAKYYFPMFEEALDKYNCPLELKYLAVIESALNPAAVSRAGATGLWQFMYNTGKMYDLEVGTLVDYRRDPLRSTDAAARHLRDLSNIFWGDWVLAIAAYNCGQGNVKKAIARSGGKTNFWDLYNYLPKETRGYVPAFYGAWYVMQYYDKYGITPAEMQFGITDTLHIDKNVHFQQVAAVLNIPIEEMRILNPAYKRDMIAGSSAAPMVLTLPVEYIIPFEQLKDSIFAYNKNLYFSANLINYEPTTSTISGDYKLTPKKHTVKKGESLNIIAKKYRTTVAEIAKNNKIKTTTTIHPGQQLIVGYTKTLMPKPKEEEVVQSADLSQSTETVENPAIDEPDNSSNERNYVMYKVEQGDNLFRIASKFKPATIEEIMEENQLNDTSLLQVGQLLKIPVYQ
ncbi:MAG: transglycosylase SLT domain-containing protein [Lentimicrobiaceae bacterium]|nr:transglycosylase SLT domain-containing protein [Lentimicrobiaceae bacterium]